MREVFGHAVLLRVRYGSWRLGFSERPLARENSRDHAPILGEFVVPGSRSQLFSGLLGSYLWWPGRSELKSVTLGLRV